MTTPPPAEAGRKNLRAFHEALGAEPAAAGARRSLGWPHRLWWPEPPTALNPQALAALTEDRQLSLWDPPEALGAQLDQAGWSLVLEQTAMHRALDEVPRAGPEPRPELDIQRPAPAELGAWTKAMSAAFGYEVPVDVGATLLGHPDAQLLGAWLRLGDGETVSAGTAVAFRTGDVVGIHQVGVTPAARRRGIARALMIRLLEDLAAGRLWPEARIRLITLQASAAGRPLYEALGFTPHGVVKTYAARSTFS